MCYLVYNVQGLDTEREYCSARVVIGSESQRFVSA